MGSVGLGQMCGKVERGGVGTDLDWSSSPHRILLVSGLVVDIPGLVPCSLNAVLAFFTPSLGNLVL